MITSLWISRAKTHDGQNNFSNQRLTLSTQKHTSLVASQAQIERMHYSQEKQKTNDLIFLDKVDESHLVAKLKQRFRNDQIYTYIGPVIIAINPYKALKKNGKSIYDVDVEMTYNGKQMHEVEPHPFALAEDAYSHLMRYTSNQCIIITGESGSGKTETSKHIMHYITSISSKRRSKVSSVVTRRVSIANQKAIDEKIEQVKDVLLGSNSVLESFGNAQTIRNNNSSRFGKYMVLQLNYSGQVIGGFITNYLLERSRVFRQAQGERNFHAFYQLLCGASEEEKQMWYLKNVEDYSFLRKKGEDNDSRKGNTMDGMDYDADYNKVRNSMTQVGISVPEQRMMYQQAAAVLWLGNLDFIDVDGISCVKQSSMKAMHIAGELLGIAPKKLEGILCSRTLTVGSGLSTTKHSVPLNMEKASNARDSLAKSLYERLFNFLVRKINNGISNDKNYRSTIGILDIYGFEIFKTNGFEQLCINYVNEKLQQLFIEQTLKVEQEEYKCECITWEKVSFFNNQIVCDLIEGSKNPIGMFPILDEQCTITDYSDESVLNKFHNQYENHQHYSKSRIKGKTFNVVHYAGTVEYDVTGFIEANMDTMFNDLRDGMAESKNAFVRSLFAADEVPANRFRRPPSTSLQFRQQVNSLIKDLNSCNPHYIRCIQPNQEKEPNRIDTTILQHQVRYLGLVENLRVRRMGYCYRETFGKFMQRFKMISEHTWPNSKEFSARKAAVELLSTEAVCVVMPNGERVPFVEDQDGPGCYALGKTKVFIRHPAGLFALERLRRDTIPSIVQLIEEAYRRFKIRSKILKMCQVYSILFAAYKKVEWNCHARKVRRLGAKSEKEGVYKEWYSVSSALIPSSNRMDRKLQQEEKNILVIWAQSYVRRYLQRKHFLFLKRAVSVFSAYWRGLTHRRKMAPAKWRSCHQAMLGVRSEFEKYMGKKKRRKDSLDRKYMGDYLNCAVRHEYRRIMKRHHQNEVLFSADAIKINQRYAYQRRILLITNDCIFNIKATNIDKPKERRQIPISKIKAVSLSRLPDNYIVIHVTDNYDYMYELVEKTECVQILRDRYRKLLRRELVVNFSNRIDYFALPSTVYTVEFQKNSDPKATGVSHSAYKSNMTITVGRL